MSIEQIVRDLLDKAIEDGLVKITSGWDDPDPQSRSSGELVGVANQLQERILEICLTGYSREHRRQEGVAMSKTKELQKGQIVCGHCHGKGVVKCNCPESERELVENHPCNKTYSSTTYSGSGYVVKQCRQCGRVFEVSYQYDEGTGSDDKYRD